MVRRIKDDPRIMSGFKKEMDRNAYCESYGCRNVTPEERDYYYNLDSPGDEPRKKLKKKQVRHGLENEEDDDC